MLIIKRSGVPQGLENIYKDDQRAGASLLWQQAERAGFVHLGKEKALGKLHLSTTRIWPTRKLESDYLSTYVEVGQEAMVLN